MKLLELIITLSLLIPPSESVTLTSFTCDPHPSNPMSACEAMRNGQDVNTKAVACPLHMMGQVWLLEGAGVRYCGDTSRHEIINGLTHIDVYRETYEQAITDGLQTRRAWRLYP